MKKRLLIAFTVLLSSTIYSQHSTKIATQQASFCDTLLNIPINPTDSCRDVSSYKNKVTVKALAGFKKDQDGIDSSAVFMTTRSSIKVVLSKPSTQTENLSFQMKLKFNTAKADTMIYSSFNLMKRAQLFGQKRNIGLTYSYPDSTFRDVDSLVSYKLQKPYEWNKVRLDYTADSMVYLYINRVLVDSAKRNSNDLLDYNEKLTLGTYEWGRYTHALVDSILLLDCTPLTTRINEEILPTDIKLFPNPCIDKLYFKGNLSNPTYLEVIDQNGLLIKEVMNKKNFLDVSNLPSGIYFLKIEIDSQIKMKKFIKL